MEIFLIYAILFSFSGSIYAMSRKISRLQERVKELEDG